MLTIRAVERAVAEVAVAANARDFEDAHGQEDELHVRVLKAIAAGARNPQALARAALRTQTIEFKRVTA